MAKRDETGGLIDRLGVAGWLLLLCGVAVLGATMLIPASLDTHDLRLQTNAIKGQLERLQKQESSHLAFQEAIARNDAQLLKRLGWEYLNLKPASADGAFAEGEHAKSWQNPLALSADAPVEAAPTRRGQLAQSMLIRYTTGESRPWVMGFAGWLILMGLVSSPADRSAEKS